ncbi:MAG: peptidoglycan-binding protein [Oscillatoriales cyanobacterium SM2_3_0]|nr:peptidoglycan-binding protein [Oscillatoriales cyanobacterium SM2_3_0]
MKDILFPTNLFPTQKSIRPSQPPEPQSGIFSEPFYQGTERPIRVRVLEKGNNGEQVKELQKLLLAHGFDPGKPDGVFGARTEQAVQEFQSAQGLEIDGLVSRATWQALQAGPEVAQDLEERPEITHIPETRANLQVDPEINLKIDSENGFGIESPDSEDFIAEAERSEADSRIGAQVDSDANVTSSDIGSELGSETTPVTPDIPAITRGDRGSQVRTLQTRLEVQGYEPGPVDGIFGPRTEAAVVAYQEARGMDPDGVVDERTWIALSREWL